MVYEKTEWNNGELPALNEDNLNKMEQGIYDNSVANTYSTNEIVIGEWINGKPIYRKVIFISALPNATTQDYPSGITNIETVVNFYGITNTGMPINTVRPSSAIETQSVGGWFNIDSNIIRIQTGQDRSSTSAYIIIEYTKTTDTAN